MASSSSKPSKTTMAIRMPFDDSARERARRVRSGHLRLGRVVSDHVADRAAAGAGADVGVSGQEILDSLGERRRLLAARPCLIGQGLVARLVCVCVEADRRAAPGTELRWGRGPDQPIGTGWGEPCLRLGGSV